MPRLTDRAVKTAGVGRRGDSDGLHLIVSDSGRRKWVFRFQMNGARRDMGLGSYPTVSLADARIAAAKRPPSRFPTWRCSYCSNG
jgi:hypothetical protein